MRRASTDQRHCGACRVEQKRKHSQRQYYTTLLFGGFYKSKRVHKQDTAVMRCSTEEQERHQSVAMEAELLAVETRLSGRPAQEINDTTALTGEQQSTLDKHKVRISSTASTLPLHV